MQNFDKFSDEMKRQATATLRTGEPELARAVLDQIIAEARSHPGFAPLHELAARIGAGVIAEALGAKKLEVAELAWKALHGLVGIPSDEVTRSQAGQCAYNMLMGYLASGHLAFAREIFDELTIWANQTPPSAELDTLLAESGLRLIVISLQLRAPAEVYEHYMPMRMAGERSPEVLDIARNRAKAALFLIVAFARAGDPDFARSLAAEARSMVQTAPDDAAMIDIKTKLDRLYSS